MMVLLLVSRNMYKEKELIIKQYLEEQVKQYEYLNEREKETKKFRHDIRGHLYFLNKLKQEGKDQEFEQYFQDIIGKMDSLDNSINVGNDIVNAVLNKANAEAESKNIKLEGYVFFRCHKSFLVNLNSVEHIDKEFAYFSGDKKAYVSVGKYMETKKKYIAVKKKIASM